MASNLNYLDPALLPLEDKLQAYLRAEKELQTAEIEATNLTHQPPTATPEFEQRSASGSYPQELEEVSSTLDDLRTDLARLRAEIIEMLPVRDEWIKVNLGYGPSRVGAFRKASASEHGTATDIYELHVVV
ncbi:hypothetical protein GCM10027346_06310 [Hymenobacter seoulensis]